MIILDEAAYASSDLVFETIFPLLEVENASFIAISTVLDEFNFFSKLLRLKDEDGEDFFCSISITTVCGDCKKLPDEEHEKCSHLDDSILPPWKSKAKYHRSKILQSVDTDKKRNARESMGIITGSYNQALVTRNIKSCFAFDQRKFYNSDVAPKRIYICIDPDGGGQSRMSVVCGFICRDDPNELPGTLVIISIDYKQCKDELLQDDLINAVIARIRSIALFQHSKIILVPENQTAFVHRRIERNFMGYPNVVVFHDNNGEKPGVRKDATRTKDYVIATNDMMEGGLIKFWKDWFSIEGANKSEYPTGKEHMADELMEEMVRYCYDEHGKLTGKINGSQDDLCIAMEMLCYYSKVIEVVPIYDKYRLATF